MASALRLREHQVQIYTTHITTTTLAAAGAAALASDYSQRQSAAEVCDGGVDLLGRLILWAMTRFD
jgi:hypothetical protein